jgi:hypothetical protein
VEVCPEITNLVNAACQCQGDEEDAACLSNAVEEQNYRFTACLIQKAMEELSLVEDYMGEEGGKERHGLRKTYDIESSKGEGDVANPPQEEVQCVRRGLPGGRVQAVRRGLQGERVQADCHGGQGQRHGRGAEEGRGEGPVGGSQEEEESLPLGCTGLPSDGQFKSSPEIVIICKTSFEISRGHISFPYCELQCCCRTFIENGFYLLQTC